MEQIFREGAQTVCFIECMRGYWVASALAAVGCDRHGVQKYILMFVNFSRRLIPLWWSRSQIPAGFIEVELGNTWFLVWVVNISFAKQMSTESGLCPFGQPKS